MVRPQQRANFFEYRAKRMTGHDQQQVAALERRPEIRLDLQRGGEFGIGQVALVAPFLCEPFGFVLRPSPQQCGAAAARQLYRQCRSPGSGTDDRNRL